MKLPFLLFSLLILTSYSLPNGCLEVDENENCLKCETQFYLTDLFNCERCPEYCIECINYNICTLCSSDANLVNANGVLFCQINLNNCSKNCLECDPDTFLCTMCSEGYYLDSQMKCQLSSQNELCISINFSDSKCTQCKADTFLYNGICYTQCPPGTQPLIDTCIDQQININECHDTNCLVCNLQYACDICNENFYLYQNSCLPECPLNTQSYEYPKKMCLNANSPISFQTGCLNEILYCRQCYYKVVCDLCEDSYLLLAGTCLFECPLDYISYNGRCVKQIIYNGLSIITPQNQSPNCPYCEECLSEDYCMKCIDKYFLYNYMCYPFCPHDYYAINGMCVKDYPTNNTESVNQSSNPLNLHGPETVGNDPMNTVLVTNLTNLNNSSAESNNQTFSSADNNTSSDNSDTHESISNANVNNQTLNSTENNTPSTNFNHPSVDDTDESISNANVNNQALNSTENNTSSNNSDHSSVDDTDESISNANVDNQALNSTENNTSSNNSDHPSSDDTVENSSMPYTSESRFNDNLTAASNEDPLNSKNLTTENFEKDLINSGCLNCITCSSENSCLKCEQDYVLYNSVCIPACPLGTTKDPEGKCQINPIMLNHINSSFFKLSVLYPGFKDVLLQENFNSSSYFLEFIKNESDPINWEFQVVNLVDQDIVYRPNFLLQDSNFTTLLYFSPNELSYLIQPNKTNIYLQKILQNEHQNFQTTVQKINKGLLVPAWTIAAASLIIPNAFGGIAWPLMNTYQEIVNYKLALHDGTQGLDTLFNTLSKMNVLPTPISMYNNQNNYQKPQKNDAEWLDLGENSTEYNKEFLSPYSGSNYKNPDTSQNKENDNLITDQEDEMLQNEQTNKNFDNFQKSDNQTSNDSENNKNNSDTKTSQKNSSSNNPNEKNNITSQKEDEKRNEKVNEKDDKKDNEKDDKKKNPSLLPDFSFNLALALGLGFFFFIIICCLRRRKNKKNNIFDKVIQSFHNKMEYGIPLKVLMILYNSLSMPTLLVVKKCSFEDFFTGLLTILAIIVLIVFYIGVPVIYVFLLKKHYTALEEDEIEKKFGCVYEGVSHEHIINVLFISILFTKKSLCLGIQVFLGNFTFLSLSLTIILNLFIIYFAIKLKPFKDMENLLVLVSTTVVSIMIAVCLILINLTFVFNQRENLTDLIEILTCFIPIIIFLSLFYKLCKYLKNKRKDMAFSKFRELEMQTKNLRFQNFIYFVLNIVSIKLLIIQATELHYFIFQKLALGQANLLMIKPAAFYPETVSIIIFSSVYLLATLSMMFFLLLIQKITSYQFFFVAQFLREFYNKWELTGNAIQHNVQNIGIIPKYLAQLLHFQLCSLCHIIKILFIPQKLTQPPLGQLVILLIDRNTFIPQHQIIHFYYIVIIFLLLIFHKKKTGISLNVKEFSRNKIFFCSSYAKPFKTASSILCHQFFFFSLLC